MMVKEDIQGSFKMKFCAKVVLLGVAAVREKTAEG